VVHVSKKPLNRQFNVLGATFPVPTIEYLGRVMFGVDTLLAFPSVLAPPAVFTEYSSGNPYQAAELFKYSANRLEIDFTPLKETRGEVSWSRLGLPLPWMKMGDSDPGPVWLLYQARGVKLANGFAPPLDLLPVALPSPVAALEVDDDEGWSAPVLPRGVPYSRRDGFGRPRGRTAFLDHAFGRGGGGARRHPRRWRSGRHGLRLDHAQPRAG